MMVQAHAGSRKASFTLPNLGPTRLQRAHVVSSCIGIRKEGRVSPQVVHVLILPTRAVGF
jgi:hypothetical protein